MTKFRRVYNRFSEANDPHWLAGYEFEGNLLAEYGQVEEILPEGILPRIHLYESVETVVDGLQDAHFFEVFKAQAEKRFIHLDTIVFDSDNMQVKGKYKYHRSTTMLFVVPNRKFLIGFTLTEFCYDEADCKPMSYWGYRICTKAPRTYIAPHGYHICYSSISIKDQMAYVEQRSIDSTASMVKIVKILDKIKDFADECENGDLEKQPLLHFTDYMTYYKPTAIAKVREHVVKINLPWIVAEYKDIK